MKWLPLILTKSNLNLKQKGGRGGTVSAAAVAPRLCSRLPALVRVCLFPFSHPHSPALVCVCSPSLIGVRLSLFVCLCPIAFACTHLCAFAQSHLQV